MSHSIPLLPQHHVSGDATVGYPAFGRFIAWAVLLGLAVWPRLWIIGFWIFSHQLGDAFSSWVAPAIGFVLLPWTTLLYAFMWGITSDGVYGWEWIVVGMPFLVDILFWVWGRASFK